MTALRLWIVLLAGLCFLCGLATGRWTTLRQVQAEGRKGVYEDYALLLEQRFELDPRRSEYLRVILDSYQRDLERLKERRLEEYEEYWSAVEPELRGLTADYEGYIRNRVLPPERRSEFDALGLASASLPIPSPSSLSGNAR